MGAPLGLSHTGEILRTLESGSQGRQHVAFSAPGTSALNLQAKEDDPGNPGRRPGRYKLEVLSWLPSVRAIIKSSDPIRFTSGRSSRVRPMPSGLSNLRIGSVASRK
jgi:hypothetical protein